MPTFTSLKEARKGLKLPGGENADVFTHGGVSSYSWHKRGGYADKVLEKLHASLRTKRWKAAGRNGSGTPDGSFIGHGEAFERNGWRLTIHETYGGVKWDNSFSIELKLITPKENVDVKEQ